MTEHSIMIKAIEEAVDKAVDRAIKGKIDNFRAEMNSKLDAQNVAIKPALDAIANWNVGSRLFKLAFGLLMALGAGYLMATKIFHIK